MAKMAYVAKCKCGGIVMACSKDHPKDAAKEVASCIRAGFDISQMSTEEVRTAKWCDNNGKCEALSAEKDTYKGA